MILAPAGNQDAFLAAVAAGADAVYCGFKRFSARMEAKNFSLEELASLTALAREKKVKTYIAFNSLIKPDELDEAGKMLAALKAHVRPDGVILQDLSLIQLLKKIGFPGQIHLSTLANVSFASALTLIRKKLNADFAVLPRELSIDEIKAMAAACPPGLNLEVFVHGALCYGVSGRCYWSSYLGGKSGLRGRCVQPCRRRYAQNRRNARVFSCLDLRLDMMVKLLLAVPEIKAWKIEGRKKGAHYVYHTVMAYKLLRDFGHESGAKKEAAALLDYSLGRKGTRYHFLPQHAKIPIDVDDQTGSGLFIGRIKGSGKDRALVPRGEILTGDRLRIGYEDDPWHALLAMKQSVPAKGRYYVKPVKGRPVPEGAPVFLIDRREKVLEDALGELRAALKPPPRIQIAASGCKADAPKQNRRKTPATDLFVSRRPGKKPPPGDPGLWLTPDAGTLPKSRMSGIWWWLPPVIWPADEAGWKTAVETALKKGARRFVLNAPWQVSFFDFPERLRLWAGPFCNLTNFLALKTMASMGFSGAVVSPELDAAGVMRLGGEAPLPVGIVLSGLWPLCISRTASDAIRTDALFTSPKGEQAWLRNIGPDVWAFPNWKIDLSAKKEALKKAGYSLFIHLHEDAPPGVALKKRAGMWNWRLNFS